MISSKNLEKILSLITYCICFSFLWESLIYFRDIFNTGHYFWDYQVYRSAIEHLQAGKNVYDSGSAGLLYVYPPTAAFIYKIFNFFNLRSIIVLGFALFFICPLIKFDLKKSRLGQFIISFTLLIGVMKIFGTKTLLTGNVAPALYFVTLIPLIFARHQLLAPKNWGIKICCLMAILFSAWVKPFFLVYLTIFLLRKDYQTNSLFFIGLALFFMAMVNPMTIDQINLWISTMSSYSANFSHDLGHGFFVLLFDKLKTNIIPLKFQALLSGALFLVLLALFLLKERKVLDSSKNESSFWHCILICLLCNPRLKIYDLYLLPFILHFAMQSKLNRPHHFITLLILTTRSQFLMQLIGIITITVRIFANDQYPFAAGIRNYISKKFSNTPVDQPT